MQINLKQEKDLERKKQQINGLETIRELSSITKKSLGNKSKDWIVRKKPVNTRRLSLFVNNANI